MRAGLRAAVLAATLAACSGAAQGPEGLPANDPGPAPAAPAPRADATLGVMFWPASWTELTERASGLARRIGVPLEGDAAELFAAPDAFAPLAAIATELGVATRLESAPAGIDPFRPIVASLFIPLADPLETASRVAALEGGSWLYAHHVIVPATDPERLAAGLEKALAAAEPAVRIAPVAGAVEIQIFVALGEPAAKAPALAAAPRPVDSAADRLMGRGGEPIARVVLRREPLRRLSPLIGLSMTARALVSYGRADAPALLAAGIGESLTGWVMQDPRGALAGDVALELPVAGPLRVELAAALTRAGARALPAGGIGTAPLDILDIDHVAVAENAPAHPALGSLDARGIGEALERCGAGCIVWAAAGNGYSLLRPALADPKVTAELAELVREVRRLRPVGLRAELALRGSALLGRVGFGLDAGVFDATDFADASPAPAVAAPGCADSVIAELTRGLVALSRIEAAQRAEALARLRGSEALACPERAGEAARRLVESLAVR